jgi:SAM-dependent methyltransferase
MRPDVVDLRDFYGTPLGAVARRAVRRCVREIWPDLRGMRVGGIGYATPYLRPLLGEAERSLALMPASQGVLHWPVDGPNSAALVDETALPLPDLSLDRIIVAHGLEHADAVRPLLREIWRVLAGSGRAIFIVPNRRSIWARVDATPFGHGQPYSANQITRMLRDNLFTPTATTSALYALPLLSRFVVATAAGWERAGRRWLRGFGGVVIVEASKTLYAPTAIRARGSILTRGTVPARTGHAASSRSTGDYISAA